MFPSDIPNQATTQTNFKQPTNMRATNHRNDPFIQKVNSFASHRNDSPNEKLYLNQGITKTGGSREDFSNFKDASFKKPGMPFPVNDVSQIESISSKKKRPLLTTRR